MSKNNRQSFRALPLNQEPTPMSIDPLRDAEPEVDPDYDASDVVAKIQEATAILKESIDGDDELPVEQATDTSTNGTEELQFDYAGFRTDHAIPTSWTDDHIDQWIAQSGYVTGKTESGSFKIDPTRKDRAVSTWPVSELVDGIRGLLPDVIEIQHGPLAKAYRQHEAVDPAWSARDLLDWLQQGLEPAKTSNGAWRNDITRHRRLAVDWTTQELIAWANGEIRAGGETTDAKAAAEINSRLALGVLTPNPEAVIQAYKRTLSKEVVVTGVQPTAATPTTLQEPVVEKPQVTPPGLTAMNASYLALQTKRYLTACAPGKPITPEIGAVEQRQLDNLFRYILGLADPVGFGSAMTYLRDFYKANRVGLFDPLYRYRFTGSLTSQADIQETHINLLDILYVYTDDDKSARKQLDLPSMVRKFPAGRQAWLIEFFQKYC